MTCRRGGILFQFCTSSAILMSSTIFESPRVRKEQDNIGQEQPESTSDGKRSMSEHDIIIPSLLPVPSTLAKPNDSLCDICKVLNLTPQQFVVYPEDGPQKQFGDPNIRLGLVQDMKNKPHCPLCRLVLIALGQDVPSFSEGEAVEVTMGWNTDGPVPDPRAPWHITPQIRTLSPFAQKQDREGDYVGGTGFNMFPQITILANDAPTPAKTFFARLIGDHINFAMVRNWLAMCHTWHGSQCDKSQMLNHKVDDPASEIPSFRLIDVVDNCIVHGPRNCKYVALSYVWGRIDPETILRTLKSNVVELEMPGALELPHNHARIPLTIRDAILVVKELHLRYLWVDSLCIIQDDLGEGSSKMDAISKMDLVYGAAYLTIIAATGNDAKAGLPGLWPRTRMVAQPVEEILPGLRLAFLSKHYDYITSSVYHSRAWTFQEQTFSKRNLLFIGGQVIYKCRLAEGWREDVFFEDRSSADGGITGNIQGDHDMEGIGEFETLIYTYSGLSLTFDTDIYHAFAGIARYFKMTLHANLCHGIPDAYFDWFLLLEALAPQTRRKCAPSWSWSGWHVGSSSHIWRWYDREINKVRNAIRNRTWIIWYQRKSHDSTEYTRVLALATKEEEMSSSSSSESSAPTNFYGGPVRDRFPFDCSRTIPTPRTLTGAPTYVADHNPSPGSGFLQFWTVSVMFKLDQPTSTNSDEDQDQDQDQDQDHDQEDEQRSSEDTRSRLGIFGKSGHQLGTILVNPDWYQTFVPKNYEFILLCEGRDVKAKRRSELDDEDGWKYKVMLIEWHGDGDGDRDGEWAERVSIGSIEKGDLDQGLEQGPVWKEIILG